MLKIKLQIRANRTGAPIKFNNIILELLAVKCWKVTWQWLQRFPRNVA